MLGLVYMDDAWSMWCSIVKVEPCGASNVPECTVYGGELDMYCMYVRTCVNSVLCSSHDGVHSIQ